MGKSQTAASKTQGFRFGLYEVDLQQQKLVKSGVRVRLQNQPFKVLEALLEQPGAIISRETLLRRLWPGETPTDFDHRINKAVNKLRVALTDSADNPRFVETLARQGYRFIAPVEVVGKPSEPAPAPAEVPAPASASPPPVSEQPGPKTWTLALVVATLLVALFGAVAWLRPGPVPQVDTFTQLSNDGRQKLDGICTNGEEVFFVEFRDGRTVLTALPLVGGEPRLIETTINPPASLFLLDVAPGGDRLLVKASDGLRHDVNDGPLWLVPVGGGAAEPFGSFLANDAKWSPDGTRLAYFTGTELHVADRAGENSRLIATKDGLNSAIRWSPDGRRIRFRAGHPTQEHNTIWEIDLDAPDPKPVFPEWEFEQLCGAWTNNGRYFLFYSPSDSNLWIHPERSSLLQERLDEPVQLTFGPMRFRSPRLLPEGDRLVAIGEVLRGELLRWDSDAGHYVPHLYGLSADQLHYSADGEWLTYTTFPENNIWIARADGSNRKQLTHGPMRTYLPRLSPDGSKIAFMGRLPGERWKIYLIGANGGEPEMLVPGPGTEADPNWSPGGQRLVYAPFPWKSGPEEHGIHILDLASGVVTKLESPERLYSPRWSPDGRFIATINQDDSLLKVFNFETQAWSTLAKLRGGFPAWSSDSRYVYAFHAFSDERGIYRMRIADGAVEKVASLQSFDVAGTLGPYGLSMAPDNSPIILRDRSLQEIYALNLRLP